MSLPSIVQTYLRTVFSLISADFIIFKADLHNYIIDNFIVIVANLIVMGMIMPQFGLVTNYAPFMFAGLIASIGVFQTIPLVYSLVNDISGDKKIVSYISILPMPTWLAFFTIILMTALRAFVVSAIMFILSLVLLYKQIDVLHIAYTQCCFILVFGSLFCAALALWITTMIRDMSVIESVWVRYIFPLWIFGGFQFSWSAMHAALGKYAYINLLNPLLYITEGLRYAMHVDGVFISFGMCILMLMLGTLACSWWALKRLKKRLDFV